MREPAASTDSIASFGLALHERAIIDALGRLQSTDVFTLVRSNRLGITPPRLPDLTGFDLAAFLDRLQPAPAIAARHTVGLVDALTAADPSPGSVSMTVCLKRWKRSIAAYGHRYFKLKVSGAIDADVERLARIAAVLDRTVADYQATLDGNEQYEHVEAVVELWRRIGEEPRLARLKARILFIEQPIARAHALAEPVHALRAEVPMEIDESDADMDAFPRARALGYRGISSKSCKGFYRALLNRARVAKWNAEEGRRATSCRRRT